MRSGALVAATQALRNWSWLWQPNKINDGLYNNAGATPAWANPFAVSGNNEDHNGYGVTLEFAYPIVMKRFNLTSTGNGKAAQYTVEYWNGSTWISVGTFTATASPNVFDLNTNVIASTKWRYYISQTNALVSNYYAWELEAWGSPQFGFSVNGDDGSTRAEALVNVFSNNVTLGFYGAGAATQVLITDDSMHATYDLDYYDDHTYAGGPQVYTARAVYDLPDRYGTYTISATIYNASGGELGTHSFRVHYLPAVPNLDFTLTPQADGSGVRLKPTVTMALLGSISTVGSYPDFWDMTYLPKEFTGFSRSLFMTASYGIVEIFTDKWEYITAISLPKSYTGICYDQVNNCLWMQGWADLDSGRVRKYTLSNDGLTVTETTTYFAATSCIGICTDGTYIYGMTRERYLYRWNKDGSGILNIYLPTTVPNCSYTEGIEYFNGCIYFGSDNGYIHVLDVSDFANPKLITELYGCGNSVKMCCDGYYLYYNVGDNILSRLSTLPKVDIYRSTVAGSGYALLGTFAPSEYLDAAAVDSTTPTLSASSPSHFIGSASRDNTIDLIWSAAQGAGTTYYYYVVSVDAYGNRSQVSNPSNLCLPFEKWTLTGGAWVDDKGVLHLPNYGAQAISPFVLLNGAANWVLTEDFFDDTPVTGSTVNGGYLQGSAYYGATYASALNTASYSGNGNAGVYPINTWTRKAWSYVGGPNVIYAKFNISSNATYTSPSFEVRLPMVSIDGKQFPYLEKSVLARSPIAGASIVVDAASSTAPDGTVDTVAGAYTTAVLPDGTYYIHVKALNQRGIASVIIHIGPFIIDLTAPVIESIEFLPAPVSTGGTLLIKVRVTE